MNGLSLATPLLQRTRCRPGGQGGDPGGQAGAHRHERRRPGRIAGDNIQRKTEAALRKDVLYTVNAFHLAASRLREFKPDEVAEGLEPGLWVASVAEFEATVQMLAALVERLTAKVVN